MLVNTMKHAAQLMLDGEVINLTPSGHVATCTETTVPHGECEGFPAVRQELGELVGLPEPKDGVTYYTNGLVFKAAVAQGRKDVVMGNSGNSAIRWTQADADAGLCTQNLVGLIRYITQLIVP